MKHGKKPTYKQKLFMDKLGLDWRNWLVERETSEFISLVNKKSGKLRNYEKER